MAIKTVNGTTARPYVHVEIRLSQAAVITATGQDAPPLTNVTGDGTGAYTTTLWANGDLTPSPTFYTVTEYLGGTDNTFTIIVPQTAGPFTMAAIASVPPGAALGSTMATINAAGDIAGRSFTASSTSGPYTAAADAGEIQTQTVKTRHSGTGGTFSITALQNADPAAPDQATRIYVLPVAGAKVTTGTAGALKIFADDYLSDSTNYRDNGHYFSADQLGDYGTQGNGTFVMSSKVNGSYAGLTPDLVFSFQAGQYTGARFSFQTDHAVTRGVFIVGDRYMGEVSATTANIAQELHGELAFNNTTPGIRWFAAANADVTKADGVIANNGPNGLATLTSATAAFTTADTYKVCDSAGNLPAATRIAYVQSATVAVMTAAATSTGSGLSFTIRSRAPVAGANKIGLNNSDLTLTLNSGQRFKVTSAGSVICGSAAGQLGTTTTDGFLYVWSMAGTPTGVPTTVTGSVPMVVDTSGIKIWFYIGGAWKGVVVA